MGKYDKKPLPEVDKELFKGIKGIDEIIDKLPHYYIKAFANITDMIVWFECAWDGKHFHSLHDSGWLFKPEDCGDYIATDDPEIDLSLIVEENKESMKRYKEISEEWLNRMARENDLITLRANFRPEAVV